MTSTLLTTGDTRANEQEALDLEFLRAADGVRIMGISAIDDDVAFLEVRLELGDEAVDRRTSLDEEDDFAGTLELGDKLLDGVCALDLGTL